MHSVLNLSQSRLHILDDLPPTPLLAVPHETKGWGGWSWAVTTLLVLAVVSPVTITQKPLVSPVVVVQQPPVRPQPIYCTFVRHISGLPL
jgi:hypothetical protein